LFGQQPLNNLNIRAAVPASRANRCRNLCGHDSFPFHSQFG